MVAPSADSIQDAGPPTWGHRGVPLLALQATQGFDNPKLVCRSGSTFALLFLVELRNMKDFARLLLPLVAQLGTVSLLRNDFPSLLLSHPLEGGVESGGLFWTCASLPLRQGSIHAILARLLSNLGIFLTQSSLSFCSYPRKSDKLKEAVKMVISQTENGLICILYILLIFTLLSCQFSSKSGVSVPFG